MLTVLLDPTRTQTHSSCVSVNCCQRLGWQYDSNLRCTSLHPNKASYHLNILLTEKLFSSVPCLSVMKDRKMVGSTEPVQVLWSFCQCTWKHAAGAQKLAAVLSFTGLWEASWSHGRRSLLDLFPQLILELWLAEPGMPAILLAMLISPRSGFKSKNANIFNVDKAISFKGQHWSLLYTLYRG